MSLNRKSGTQVHSIVVNPENKQNLMVGKKKKKYSYHMLTYIKVKALQGTKVYDQSQMGIYIYMERTHPNEGL